MSKINIASVVGTVSLVLTLLTPTAATATDCSGFNSGDGSETTPYLITTVEEFENLENCKLDKYFKVANDIDFGGTEPGTGISSFIGKLDGNNKKLSNLKVNASVDTGDGNHYLGVFQEIENNAEITNLRVEGLEIAELATSTQVGFIGRASDNFTLSNLRLSGVSHSATLPKENFSQGVGGLIGQAFLSSNSTVEKIDLEVSLGCYAGSECGGLIGESIVESSGAVIDTVYVRTNFAQLSSDVGSNSGGLLGEVIGGDGMTVDLTVTDSLVSLTNQTPQVGYRVGGVAGFVGSNSVNTTVDLILDRISIGGVIPNVTGNRGALVSYLQESGDASNNTILTPKEIVIAASYDSPENGTSLQWGGRHPDTEVDTSSMKLYHDTESTNNTAPITKIATADKSDPDTYKRAGYELTITDNLQPLFDWYVQEPDIEGSADGLDPNGYIGSIFNGYPVPANLANTGFLGNRFYFKDNFDDPEQTIGRLGYANGGAGLDTIPNPFSRTNFEFTGWSNSRTPGDLFEVGEAINGFHNSSVFAQWQEIFVITFGDSLADSGSAPASITAKPTFTVPGPGDLQRAGYQFGGWEVRKSNPKVVYQEGQVVTATGDITLVPTWLTAFDVTFNSGGADSGSVAAQTDKTSTTAPNKGDLIRNGFTFAGWQDQDGNDYAVGDTINLTKDLTLTAQWAELFDVSFNTGGADSGSVAAQTDKLSFTVPGEGDLIRNGFTFAGWKDQDGTSYTAGQSVNLTKDLTLTAQWTASAPPPAPAPAPYLGPLISGVEQPAESDFTTAGLQTVTVKGTRLNTVRSVVIHEITVEVTEASYSSFSFALPAGLPAGKHDLTVRSAFGNIKYLSGVEVKEAPVAEPVIETERTKPKQKVNAGSFKGYVAVYALGHEGKKLSAKIGKDWVVVPEIPARDNNLYRVTDFTGAGVDIQVRIYIDRELLETIPLTTK